MSKSIWSMGQSIPRRSFEELGISKARYLELRSGCMTGKYSRRMLSKACIGLEDVKPWILLSVTENKPYEVIEFDARLGRICVGRTNFYALRRQFYHNLDCLLKNEQGDGLVRESDG